MKNIYFILFLILFSCSKKQNISKNNISKDLFTNILEEIYLAESEFQLNKANNTRRHENKLSSDYELIFSKNNVNKTDFENTLQYYSERPDLLDDIYEEILLNLKIKKELLN